MPRILLIFLLVMLVTEVSAQAGDATIGRKIAEQWCISCHSVNPMTARDVVKSFPAMAKDATKTENYLRNWLLQPHPSMPDFNLARDDVDHIVAFVRSLDGN